MIYHFILLICMLNTSLKRQSFLRELEVKGNGRSHFKGVVYMLAVCMLRRNGDGVYILPS